MSVPSYSQTLRRTAVLGAVTALLLAGCTPAPGADPDPMPTVTVTATPEAPAPRADYGFTFFEEAEIGSTWDEMSEQLNYPVAGMDECPHYGPVWQTAHTYGSAFMDPDGLTTGTIFFYLQQGASTNPEHYPRNAEGVGIGSTVAEVLAAYPGAAQSSFTDIGAGDLDLITVEDPDSDSKYVFASYPGSTTITLLQWGPSAGNQWSHLCSGI
jgi:hypothetical protein